MDAELTEEDTGTSDPDNDTSGEPNEADDPDRPDAGESGAGDIEAQTDIELDIDVEVGIDEAPERDRATVTIQLDLGGELPGQLAQLAGLQGKPVAELIGEMIRQAFLSLPAERELP